MDFKEAAINPYREFVTGISTDEFEIVCMNILKAYAEKENLKDFKIEHDVKMQASDGEYQMDVFAQFVAMGTHFKVLAECKQYTSPVKREKVEILHSRINSLGMNKGILMSTSGFQSGAVKFALEHGIALIQIFDKHVKFIVQAYDLKKNIEFLREQYLMRYPKYIACEWSILDMPDVDVYPSEKMIAAMTEDIKKMVKDKNLF